MRNWDFLEGVRAHTPSEVAVREMGKLLAEELGNWPPRLEWIGDKHSVGSRQVTASGSLAPSVGACREALKLARWELERNLPALNDYQRNHHLDRAFPDRGEQQLVTFLCAYFCEAFFGLMERTENRIKRREILAGWSELSKRVVLALDQESPLLL